MGPRKQSGIVLLMLAIVVALALSSLYFRSISIEDVKFEEMEQTQKALGDAKQALIKYAVMHASNGVDPGIGNGGLVEYGHLPCPYITDAVGVTDDGRQEGTCTGTYQNTIGLLPWYSMQTEIFRDGSGNCLWYVLSGNYKHNPSAGMINPDTIGAMQIADAGNNVIIGNNAEDRPVAIVIAPGHALDLTGAADQLRVEMPGAGEPGLACGTDGTQSAQFLDTNGVTDNATLNGADHTPDVFINADLNSLDPEAAVPYNDQIVMITRDDIWDAVYQTDIQDRLVELTQGLAECLAAYANHAANGDRRLPWPAPLDADDYRDVGDYDDVDGAAQGYAGRYPYFVNDSNTEITLAVAPDFMDTPGLCDNLVGGAVDLSDTASLHYRLYENWKDHFFYALSKTYEPDGGAGEATCGNCVSVNGVDYAAVVFFAGRADDGLGQTRVYEQDSMGTEVCDDKSDVTNYLENGNGTLFPDAAGNAAFNGAAGVPVPSAQAEDVRFCITNEAVTVSPAPKVTLNVVAC